MATEARLLEVLEEAQARGFVGPGPIEAHLAVARSGLDLLAGVRSAVDLGSGGGALGLPLAVWGPEVRWVLVESSTTRASFLRRAVGRCGLDGRVEVLAVAAEVVGRDPAHRAAHDLVVVPVLRAAGHHGGVRLAASAARRHGWPSPSPPTDQGNERLAGRGSWPSSARAVRHQIGSFRVLEQVGACPDRFPRRTGVPRRRPLFGS